MYELMRLLIAFKYACKINHWRTNNYAAHLQFDRLGESIDEWVDRIAECYFMASDNKNLLRSDLLAPKLIDKNLTHMCESIIVHLESIQADDDLNEGLRSMLSTIEEEMLNKLALVKLS